MYCLLSENYMIDFSSDIPLVKFHKVLNSSNILLFLLPGSFSPAPPPVAKAAESKDKTKESCTGKHCNHLVKKTGATKCERMWENHLNSRGVWAADRAAQMTEHLTTSVLMDRKEAPTTELSQKT